jgi:hypothetical protein
MLKIVRQFVAGFLVLGAMLVVAGPAGALKPSAKVPNPCTVITAADIQSTLASHGATLTPSAVGTPTKSKPTNQGGFGPHVCETSFNLPDSIVGTVDVFAPKQVAGTGCAAKGQPGKKTTLGSVRALIEFTPDKKIRDITFPDGKACVTVEMSLSGSEVALPTSEFVSLAKAALAKKG